MSRLSTAMASCKCKQVVVAVALIVVVALVVILFGQSTGLRRRKSLIVTGKSQHAKRWSDAIERQRLRNGKMNKFNAQMALDRFKNKGRSQQMYRPSIDNRQNYPSRDTRLEARMPERDIIPKVQLQEPILQAKSDVQVKRATISTISPIRKRPKQRMKDLKLKIKKLTNNKDSLSETERRQLNKLKQSLQNLKMYMNATISRRKAMEANRLKLGSESPKKLAGQGYLNVKQSSHTNLSDQAIGGNKARENVPGVETIRRDKKPQSAPQLADPDSRRKLGSQQGQQGQESVYSRRQQRPGDQWGNMGRSGNRQSRYNARNRNIGSANMNDNQQGASNRRQYRPPNDIRAQQNYQDRGLAGDQVWNNGPNRESRVFPVNPRRGLQREGFRQGQRESRNLPLDSRNTIRDQRWDMKPGQYSAASPSKFRPADSGDQLYKRNLRPKSSNIAQPLQVLNYGDGSPELPRGRLPANVPRKSIQPQRRPRYQNDGSPELIRQRQGGEFQSRNLKTNLISRQDAQPPKPYEKVGIQGEPSDPRKGLQRQKVPRYQNDGSPYLQGRQPANLQNPVQYGVGVP